ncbi:profilin-4-like isoform X2 [Branchiostoma floridae x Branchiostoma belcheri]
MLGKHLYAWPEYMYPAVTQPNEKRRAVSWHSHIHHTEASCAFDKVKMNQLQNLLHDALISTEHVEHCCILRRKDVSLRASSVGFTLYQDQIQMFVDAFKNPPQTREDGLYFEDRHYKCVRADKNAVYAKCGKRGLVIVRTGSLLIVGTYNDNMYPSVCVEAVEKLVDYFKEKGK